MSIMFCPVSGHFQVIRIAWSSVCYFCANLLARAYRIANCVIRDPRCAAPPSAVRTPSLEGSHKDVDDQRLEDHLPVEGQPCNGGRGDSWSIISSSSSSSMFCFLGFVPPLLPPTPPTFKDSPALPLLAIGERRITSPERNVLKLFLSCWGISRLTLGSPPVPRVQFFNIVLSHCLCEGGGVKGFLDDGAWGYHQSCISYLQLVFQLGGTAYKTNL